VEIVFFETGSHHPDNVRFIKECEEKLFNKKIRIEQSKYVNVPDLIRKLKVINFVTGAECTRTMKKRMREKLEKREHFDHQIFGFEFESRQVKRAQRFTEQYPHTNPIFPLIENKMTKIDCILELKKHDIELPMMYRLGYHNNNCVMCVKGGMGYMNKMRVDFPEQFNEMARIEREINQTCLLETKDGKRVKLFLDELDPSRGRHEKPLTDECGILCEVEFVDS
jgi:3'-phosphoadenosine 5'-phosphosulfate sulfotransferase (PAPS reductase)/FAD synthetase